jgi:mediator of RNA polymerase II transcription subunit 16, fungi type
MLTCIQSVRLVRQDDVYNNTAILLVHPTMYNTILILYHSDGSVDFRHTRTMESITEDFNTQQVTSLMQAGFAFSISEPGRIPSKQGHIRRMLLTIC